jgi:hypothetical protein
MKEARLQWLQDPSEKRVCGYNLNNIRLEASRHFGIRRRKYLKDKTNELATDSKNKNIRDKCRRINLLKRGYLPRSTSNLVKDGNGDSYNS